MNELNEKGFSAIGIILVIVVVIVIAVIGLLVHKDQHKKDNQNSVVTYTKTSPVNLEKCNSDNTFTKKQSASFLSAFQQGNSASLTVGYTCGGTSVANGAYYVGNVLETDHKQITDQQTPVYDASPSQSTTNLECSISDISTSSAVVNCGSTNITL